MARIPGVDVPSAARVSNVLASLLLLLYLLLASLLFLAVAVACVPTVANCPFPSATLLLLASPDVPIFYFAGIIPAVSVVLSDIDLSNKRSFVLCRRGAKRGGRGAG